MELILLVLIAGVAGYFLAGSKYSKSIDQTASKVSDSSKDVADKTKNWWDGLFGDRRQTEAKSEKSTEKVVVVEDTKKPAEKTVSRRKSEETEQTTTDK
jgi:hypothetical protein